MPLCLGLVLSIGLVGCGPKEPYILGISRTVAGNVVASFELCEGEEGLTFTVLDEDAAEGESEWWSITHSVENIETSQVVVFEVPNGWELKINSLTEIRSNRQYSASISTTRARTATVDFSLEDLSSLAEDQVWTKVADRTYDAVSRDEFEEAAAATCSSRSTATRI